MELAKERGDHEQARGGIASDGTDSPFVNSASWCLSATPNLSRIASLALTSAFVMMIANAQ
jgi:hypothetical protein